MPATVSLAGVVGTTGSPTTLTLAAKPTQVTLMVNDTTSGGGQTFYAINSETSGTSNSCIRANGNPVTISNRIGIGTLTLVARADHLGQEYTVADTFRFSGT